MAAGDAIRGQAGVAVQQAGNAAQLGSGISQTAFLFATLAFAFLFFITIKGDLPKWLGVFGFASPSPSPSSSQASPGTGGALGSMPTSIPGTNTAGSAVPDSIAGPDGTNAVAYPSLPNLGGMPTGN